MSDKIHTHDNLFCDYFDQQNFKTQHYEHAVTCSRQLLKSISSSVVELLAATCEASVRFRASTFTFNCNH